MKKYIALMLVICMAMGLCACTKPAEPTTVPTTTAEPTTVPTTAPVTQPTTQPTVPETTVDLTAVPQISMTAITMTTEIERNEDGVDFEYRYPNVELLLPDPNITNTVMLELLNRIDETRSMADDTMSNVESGISGFYDVRYNPMRIDANVLSLAGSRTSYAGGAHPYSESVSVTYDLTTGAALKLSDILFSTCTADSITPLVTNALAAMEGEVYLYDDYISCVEERFGQGLDVDQGWYLSEEGLCFYFSPYEIAPYAEGEILALIPYEELTGLLKDQYYPVEKTGGAGVIMADLFKESDLNRFEQFSNVIIDEEGESVLLYTNGLVYDLTLEYGSCYDDSMQFVPISTVFAASSMAANEAIMVRLFIPDVMSNLRLTYTTDAGTTQKYIFQSGKDGSILLLDE